MADWQPISSLRPLYEPALTLKVMAGNGSPAPVFESDDERSSFVIRLPAHPKAQATSMAATDQVTGEVTGEVSKLLQVLDGQMSRQQLQQALALKHEDHFRQTYLVPALEAGLVDMTLPGTPRSSKQRYRLTASGSQKRQALDAQK
jgi:ATP-dependent DNA helicase RecG